MNTIYCHICKLEQKVLTVIGGDNRTTYDLSCGHRFVTLETFDQVKAYDMLGIKKKGKEDFSKDHKWEKEITVGERIGRDGKPAYVHQVIDRASNYYKKFVEQGNKIIKDIEGKLTDHRR